MQVTEGIDVQDVGEAWCETEIGEERSKQMPGIALHKNNQATEEELKNID